MSEPDDRELEQYLKGDSAVSRRYREAGGEMTPPALDEAVLARARAELRRKPAGASRWLSGLALAASVVLGVNLGWNVYQAEPVPADVPALQNSQARKDEFVAEPPRAAEAPAARVEPEVKLKERPAARKDQAARSEAPGVGGASGAPMAADEMRESDAQAAAQLKRALDDDAALAARQEGETARRDMMLRSAEPAAAAGRAADHVPTAAQEIEALIRYVAGLEGAVFIRNGSEHTPADAARHLRLKRDKAGDRCATAEQFIATCASRSSASGESYLIRFADGRTRAAEDVLREFLAQMRAAP